MSKGTEDLLQFVIGTSDSPDVDADGVLRADTELDGILPTDSSIVEYYVAGRMWDPDDENVTPNSVVVAVRVFSGASERNNTLDEQTLTLDVEIAATNEFIEDHGPNVIRSAADRVHDVLTRHYPGWRSEGESGGFDGVTADADRNRYLIVKSFDYSPNANPHAVYADE